MSAPLIEVRRLDLHTMEGRPLVQQLTLDLGRDRVALVGRNGVGKSTLLEVLAGDREPTAGAVRRRGQLVRVPQNLDTPVSASPGERRKRALAEAFDSDADVLLLDEPTEDLDHTGRKGLFQALRAWRGGLLVVSHDTELLQHFRHFFVMEEAGCHLVNGTVETLVHSRQQAERDAELRYLQRMQTLLQKEAKHRRIQRRRQRKKAVGRRLHELDRNQSRIRLNSRRGLAQISQGRVNRIAESRISATRAWLRSARQALAVELSLTDAVPRPAGGEGPALVAEHLTVERGGRVLFEDVCLSVDRERHAVTGDNGTGKTTLLETLVGLRKPARGQVRTDLLRVGFIAQGGANWQLQESLAEWLTRVAAPDAVARLLVAHRFPLALADRPLASLSPGERTRAALIALFQRPQLDVLVLDEPTRSLDLVGVAALTEALCAWEGGLVVASHDRPFLSSLNLGDDSLAQKSKFGR